jgi:hypothetical protein
VSKKRVNYRVSLSKVLFILLNEKGEKRQTFQILSFGKQAGMDSLQSISTKEKMKTEPTKDILKKFLEVAVHHEDNENDFKKQLVDH